MDRPPHPGDRSAWHSLVQQAYNDWLSDRPACAAWAPARRAGGDDPVAVSLWRLDVFRDPLRYRVRLCGRIVVRSLCWDVTGRWLDEVHPLSTGG